MCLQLDEKMLHELVKQFEVGIADDDKKDAEKAGPSQLVAATKSVEKTLKKEAKKRKKNNE